MLLYKIANKMGVWWELSEMKLWVERQIKVWQFNLCFLISECIYVTSLVAIVST